MALPPSAAARHAGRHLRLALVAALLLACASGGGEPTPSATPGVTSTGTPAATATRPPSPSPTPAQSCTPTPAPQVTPTATPEATPELIAPLPPPGSGERWIDVDLSEQTATAMAGTTPWHTALVTTGKEGTQTPTGEFRIIERVFDETMVGGSGADAYFIPHVLFTQYFTTRAHALHLNYWADADVFGREPTSHGCIGMMFGDAEYFWYFAAIGTRIVVHD